jgi:hypothetical protein
MFAKNKVSQSMIDAVNSVITEDEKKRLINDGEIDETGFHKAAHAAKKAGQSHFEFQGKKYPATAKSHAEAIEMDEATEKVSTPTGMKVYGSSYGNSAKARKDQTKSAVDDLKGPKDKEMKAMDKEPKRNLDEDGDCVTPPQAKKIAKKEVSYHNATMHQSQKSTVKKEEMSFAERLIASLQEDKTTGTVEIFTDNNLGEEEMTDKQKAKREKIVMSMKKGEAGMKQRYGKNWKNVMYATATKQAMKEDSSDSYEELTEAEVITAADTPERVTTDMLQGRVEGGKSNAFKSVKLALRTDGEMKAPEIEKGEDTKEKQKISTTPGAVDIKLDDKLTTPPQKYFSSQEAITSEEVRGELAHIRSKQKNAHKTELDTFEKKVSQKEEVKRSDIPAFLRKIRGDKKLTPSEVKAGSKDSISHPDNLAKARNEEVEINESDLHGMAYKHGWSHKQNTYGAELHHPKHGSIGIDRYGHWYHHDNETKASGKVKAHGEYDNLEKHLSSLKEETELDEKVIAGTPGWKETPKDVKDKSGAVHTPMSRAKDLARTAFKKMKSEMLGKISN